MSDEVKPFGIPLVFEYTATHYCKSCHTWGGTAPDEYTCGNCGLHGFLIPNPFPDNMIPYVVLPAATGSPLTEETEA